MRSIVPTTCKSWNFDIRSEVRSISDLPISSQWAKFQLFCIGTFPFTPNGVAFVHRWWPRCQFSSVTLKGLLRYPKSPTIFFANNFWFRIKMWEWFHCISLVKTHRVISNMTYLGRRATLTWGQILALIFQCQQVYVCRLEPFTGQNSETHSTPLRSAGSISIHIRIFR